MKNKIQQLFITAMKAKDENAKAALSGLKAKITEAEKVNGTEVDDNTIIKIISTAIKQRQQSYEAFTQANRDDLARKEYDEMLVLESLMPQQMSEKELIDTVTSILKQVYEPQMPWKVAAGKTIGIFNRQYQGQASARQVSDIVEFLLDQINQHD